MDLPVREFAPGAGFATGRADEAAWSLDGSAVQRESGLTTGLLLIVALKLATALLLWTAFVLLEIARGSDVQALVTQLAIRLFRGNPPGLAIRWIADNLAFVTPVQMSRIALASAAYALVESTEAVGLLLRKRWAEWLVILVTVSFIPVEVFEILTNPHKLKIATLIVNVAILWYLLRLIQSKRARGLA